mgnify:CR=1 FL=1
MPSPTHPFSRREFLKTSTAGLGLMAFSQYAPAFVGETLRNGGAKAERDRRILVLVQLAGGNDGLNTVVPFTDDNYHKLRPSLRIQPKDVHRLNDNLGLHPACEGLKRLWGEGHLAIIQNVGYPNPNRSHFRSTEIWETATDSDDHNYTGWLGRYLDSACGGAPAEDPHAITMADEISPALMSDHAHNLFSAANVQRRAANKRQKALLQSLSEADVQDSNATYLQHTMLNALVTEDRVAKALGADKPAAEYPRSGLGNNLKNIAALIAANLETRLYFAKLGGFDTHANQAGNHANRLGDVSAALHAFHQDLRKRGLSDRVLVMTFSEFGRRPAENGSNGTDHGTAAPLFVIGDGLKGTLFGTAPDLNIEKNKDLTFSTDFRSVYATVLDQWLESPHEAVLGQPYKTLDLV